MRVLAIHGLGCSATMGWPRVARALASQHELVAPSLVGADGAAYLRRFEAIDTGEGSYASWLARWDSRVLHRMASDLGAGDTGDTPWADALASFPFPVRVVQGAKSDDIARDIHASTLRRLGLPFHVIEGSAHFVPSETPELLERVLERAARGVAPEAPPA